MKNKALKIVLALLFMFSLTAFVVIFTNNKVYAEEIVDSLEDDDTTDETPSTDEEATTTEEQQETTSLTQEEKTKLDSIVEWLSTLNKDELFDYLNAAKNWLIAGGIVTVIGFLSAIIGLAVSILKLQRQKAINSDKEEKQKQKELERIEKFEELVKKKNDEVKMLLLSLINNADNEEKKAIESNINDVRAKIEQALAESTKNE